LGGGGLLVFGLSGYLGKRWAAVAIEREKSRLSLSIEQAKSEMVRSIEREKTELAKFHEAHKADLLELSTQRQDALNRKRDIYTELATRMRVLLKTKVTPQQQEEGRWGLGAAYDKGYIWASESVVGAMHDLLAALEILSAFDKRLKDSTTTSPDAVPAMTAESLRLSAEARALYQRCMLEMRRDSGFEESAAVYRVVAIE
jgi:prefoldin subunit 5